MWIRWQGSLPSAAQCGRPGRGRRSETEQPARTTCMCQPFARPTIHPSSHHTHSHQKSTGVAESTPSPRLPSRPISCWPTSGWAAASPGPANCWDALRPRLASG